MSHRDPPLPEWFWKAPAGTCRWCNEPTLYPEGHKRAGEVNTRRNWHDGCVGHYRITKFGEDQRRYVRKADGGLCRACGWDVTKAVGYRRTPRVLWLPPNVEVRGAYPWTSFQSRKDWVQACQLERDYRDWQADHIVPLWSVDRDAPDALRFWGPENLQLLCGDCHKAKSAREAKARAGRSRAAGTDDLFRGAA